MSGHKQQVIFIHGGMSFSRHDDFLAYLRTGSIAASLEEPKKRWKDRLRADLGAGFEVFMPSMPNKQNAKYEEWKIWFGRHLPQLRNGSILAGHSQGGYFLAKYLVENRMPISVRALVLVAAPIGSDNFGGEDGGDFNFDVTKLSNIEQQVEQVVLFHSKDDAVVPFSHAKRYKEALPNAELVSFDDRGHFLGEAFPEFVDTIKELARIS